MTGVTAGYGDGKVRANMTERSSRHQLSVRLAVPSALVALTLVSCGGDGGGGAPAAPPPPIPLSWNDVPDGITVRVGEDETFTALLSAAVPATYSAGASSGAATVSGREVRTGVYEVTVTGVEAGEVQVTLRANHTGYTTATASVDVVVEDPFDQNLWRELVYDAFDCPNGTSREICMRRWGEREVEQRITVVLRGQPNFHLSVNDRDWPWDFTSFQQSTIRDAIRESVRQATGETFTGRITSNRFIRDQAGWVDILPVGDEFFGDGRGPCGAALVGEPAGIIVINVDQIGDCDLASVAVHEVGHALGFFHVLDLGDYIMSPHLSAIPPEFSESEIFHTELAWELGRGLPFTPDPREGSSFSRMSMARSTFARKKTLAEGRAALPELTICPLH